MILRAFYIGITATLTFSVLFLNPSLFLHIQLITVDPRHLKRGLNEFNAKLSSCGCPTLETAIANRIGRLPAIKLLEIGCGDGNLLKDLRLMFPSGLELHGINHPQWPSKISTDCFIYHRLDAQDLSILPSNSFDFIVSQVTLEHISNKARVLEESARLLVSGGIFLHELDSWSAVDRFLVYVDLPRFVLCRNRIHIPTIKYLAERGVQVKVRIKDGTGFAMARYQKDSEGRSLDLRLVDLKPFLLKSFWARFRGVYGWGIRSAYRTL